jgi:hypothetical protein
MTGITGFFTFLAMGKSREVNAGYYSIVCTSLKTHSAFFFSRSMVINHHIVEPLSLEMAWLDTQV